MIAVASTVLLISAYRVGEHKSSTFGKAYRRFTNNWGGEIEISPPRFYYYTFDTVVTSLHNDSITTYEINKNIINVFPQTIDLKTVLGFESKTENWIKFNSYTLQSEDRYRLSWKGVKDRDIFMKLDIPEGTSLLYHFAILLNGKESENISLNQEILVHKANSKQVTTDLQLSYKSHGLDRYQYNLSHYSQNVLEHVNAVITINRSNFELLNFGFPHVTEKDKDGNVTLTMSADKLYQGQNIGVSFESRVMHLNEVQKMIRLSPIAIILFVLVLLIYSQTHDVRLWGVYYFFSIAIHLFYFLFLSYLVRFFGLYGSLSISLGLTLLLGSIFYLKITNKNVYIRTILPYFLVLTFGFTLVFLIPILQGISFLILLFGVFLSLMFKIINSDFTKWYLLLNDKKE